MCNVVRWVERYYETLKLSYWIRAEVLYRQSSILAEVGVGSFKRKCSTWWSVAQGSSYLLPQLEYDFPLKYESEYAFQTFRLFLLFIKGPVCVCNLCLSPFFSQFYWALYFNVVSILPLTDISFPCIQTTSFQYHENSWSQLFSSPKWIIF